MHQRNVFLFSGIVVLLILAFAYFTTTLFTTTPEKKVETYIVRISKTYEVVEEPVDRHELMGVAPGITAFLLHDETVKRQGAILGGHEGTYKIIKSQLSVDPDATLEKVFHQGAGMVNKLTTGGDYDAGYIAALGYWTRYAVEEGHTYPLFSDGTHGSESQHFIAKEPKDIYLDWVILASYDPSTIENSTPGEPGE